MDLHEGGVIKESSDKQNSKASYDVNSTLGHQDPISFHPYLHIVHPQESRLEVGIA